MGKRETYSKEMQEIIEHVHQYNIEKSADIADKCDRLEVEYREKAVDICTIKGMPMWRSDIISNMAFSRGLNSYMCISHRHGVATLRLTILDN